ncbi:MAG: hypothetical protein HFJ11_01215 [Bacilli bacterium]|nr:hypothetical protein [Bacilli bacterium]
MKKTYKSILILVTLITLLILYLINSNIIVNAIIDYSILFLTKLFPVSLLFFIFSTLLIDYGLIELIQYYLKINTSSLYVLLISAISGFPSGAKYTKELLEKNLIDENTANKIIMFSHFPNPLFILGSVYLVLKDKEICLKLLLAIIISNIIIYIFSKDKKSTKNNIKKLKVPSNFSNVLSKAVTNAFNTLLLIYGTSLFFYLVATIITKYITLNTNCFIILNGFFDLTKGVFSTTLLNNLTLRAIYILIFISFGGLSIHMQVKSIITDTSIKYKYFFIGRIIGTILALIIFILIL